jgi:rSAM/selenodomain-associated transferase 2
VTNNVRISVLVPAFNEEAVIGATLAHARTTLDPHEIVVGDACSTDKTAAIAGAYARVLTRKMSRGAILNDAASTATGDVVLFLHADTLLPPDAASRIATALRDPRVVGGAFRLRLDDPAWAARLISHSVNLRTSLLQTFFGDQAMFVRRDVFLRCGGFQDWSVMEDLEILSRLRPYGHLQLLDAEVITSARRHRNNGWLKTITTIWGICLLNRFGVPGQVLVRLYKPQR